MSTRWYYQIDGKSHGPVRSRELIELAKNGTLRPTDFIRQENVSEWALAKRASVLWDQSQHVPANMPMPAAKAPPIAPLQSTDKPVRPPQTATETASPTAVSQREAVAQQKIETAAAEETAPQSRLSIVKKTTLWSIRGILLASRETGAIVKATVLHFAKVVWLTTVGICRLILLAGRKAFRLTVTKQPNLLNPELQAQPQSKTSSLNIETTEVVKSPLLRLRPQGIRHGIRLVCGYAVLLLVCWKWISAQNSNPISTQIGVTEQANTSSLSETSAQSDDLNTSSNGRNELVNPVQTTDETSNVKAVARDAEAPQPNSIDSKLAEIKSPDSVVAQSKTAPITPTKSTAGSVMSSDFDLTTIADLLPFESEEPPGAASITNHGSQRYATNSVAGLAMIAVRQGLQFREDVQRFSEMVQYARRRWQDALRSGEGVEEARHEFAEWLTQKEMYYSGGSFGDARMQKIAGVVGGDVDGGIPETAKNNFSSYMIAATSKGNYNVERNKKWMRDYLRDRNWYELDRTGIDFPWEHDDAQYLRVLVFRYSGDRPLAEVDQDCSNLMKQFGEEQVLQATHLIRGAKRDPSTSELLRPQELQLHEKRPDKAVLELAARANSESYLKYIASRNSSDLHGWGYDASMCDRWYWAYGREKVLQVADALRTAKRDDHGELVDPVGLGCFRSTPSPGPYQALNQILSQDNGGYIRYIVALGNPEKSPAEIESLIAELNRKYGEEKVLQATHELRRYREIPPEFLKPKTTESEQATDAIQGTDVSKNKQSDQATQPNKAAQTNNTKPKPAATADNPEFVPKELLFEVFEGFRNKKDITTLFPVGGGAFTRGPRQWSAPNHSYVYRKEDHEGFRDLSDHDLLLRALSDGPQKVFGDLVETAMDNPVYSAWAKFKGGTRVRYEFNYRMDLTNLSNQHLFLRGRRFETYTIAELNPSRLLIQCTTQQIKVTTDAKGNETVEETEEDPAEQCLIAAKMSSEEFNRWFGADNRSRYCFALGLPTKIRMIRSLPKLGEEMVRVGKTSVKCVTYEFVDLEIVYEKGFIRWTDNNRKQKIWLSDEIPGRLVRWTEEYKPRTVGVGTEGLEKHECKLVAVDDDTPD